MAATHPATRRAKTPRPPAKPPRPKAGREPKPDAAPFTVFLDRDGVFNVNPKLAVFRRDGFRWLPGVHAAFARLNRPGIQTSLCTNQPLLGFFTLGRRIRTLNRALQEHMAKAGGRLDHTEAALAPPGTPVVARLLPGRLGKAALRRKPGPGMLEDAAEALGRVDKARAVMVGDKVRDAQAAAAYGVPCILLHTTESEAALRRKLARHKVPVHAIVAGLPEAVDLILAMVDAKR